MNPRLPMPELERPRSPPRKLMHVVDAGADCMVLFECGRCGLRSDWQEMSMTQAKRGVPCPTCNQEPPHAD